MKPQRSKILIENKKTIIIKLYYDIAPTELFLDLENQIDQLVYKLYDLTKKEIKIVEGQ